MKRRALTDREKAARYHECDGRCDGCNQRVELGEAVWDHHNALWISGDNDPSNFFPMHADCHKEKTRGDVGVIAKLKRLIARESGTRRQRKAIPQRADPWPPKGARKIRSRPF